MGRALYTVAGFAFATFLTLPIASGQEGFTARPTAAAAKPPLPVVAASNVRTVMKRPNPSQSLTGPGSSSRDVLDNFQVNENRIIRTEDSRRMGARYLNETELSSNRDCLLWCWETTNCNVAVFEEKGKGSCYLFDCGPPSHFLCLFTAHAYYTVSVLTVPSRNTAEAPAWGSPHEQELTQLRQPRPQANAGPPPRDPSAVTQAPRPAPTTSSPHQANRGQAETDQDEQTDSRHCQHYQFRCQNSSECIAVYNVCDGIPQCQDGSDEAEDLKCPGAKIVEASSVVANPPTTTLPTTADHAKPGSTTVVASEQQNRVPVINSPQPSLTDDSPRHNPMADIGRMPRPGLGGSHGGFPALSHSSRLRWGDDAGSHNRPRPEYRDPYEEPFLGGGGEQAKYYDYGQSYPESSRYWINDPDAQLYPMVADGLMQSQSFRAQKPRMNLQQQQQQQQHQYQQQQIQQQQQELQQQQQQQQRLQQQRFQQQQQFRQHQLKQLQHELQQQKQQVAAIQDYQPSHWKMGRGPLVPVDSSDSYGAQPYAPTLAPYGRHLHSGIGPGHSGRPSQGLQVDMPVNVAADSASSGQQQSLPQEQPTDTQMESQPPLQEQPKPKPHPVMPAKPVAPAATEDDTFYQPVVEVAPPPAPHQGSSKHLSKHLQKPNAKPAKAAATSAASNHHNERPVQFSRLHEVANMQVSFTQVEQGGRGAEQESGSAVLALTLGLCITGLLLVLVGCRLRLARHRLARRGGRSALAHDADYLVNGMYL